MKCTPVKLHSSNGKGITLLLVEMTFTLIALDREFTSSPQTLCNTKRFACCGNMCTCTSILFIAACMIIQLAYTMFAPNWIPFTIVLWQIKCSYSNCKSDVCEHQTIRQCGTWTLLSFDYTIEWHSIIYKSNANSLSTSRT